MAPICFTIPNGSDVALSGFMFPAMRFSVSTLLQMESTFVCNGSMTLSDWENKFPKQRRNKIENENFILRGCVMFCLPQRHGENYKTNLFIPDFNNGTLKLIK